MAYSDDEQEDDQNQQDDVDTNDDDETDDSDTASSSGAQAVANASPAQQDAHKNMIGEALSQLSDRGIDIDALATKAGIDSSDVDELSHGDLASITGYLAQHHPEVLQQAQSQFPQANGILQSIAGSQGGLGSLLGRFLGK